VDSEVDYVATGHLATSSPAAMLDEAQSEPL
jgi:hypothetical protein